MGIIGLLAGVPTKARSVSLPSDPATQHRARMAFWDEQRRGANCFNEVVTFEWWQAAKDAGIEVVRLAPNKWPSAQPDFLVGSADDFDGVVAEDLLRLMAVLDDADSAGVKVVLTTLTLPGARWRQHNSDLSDPRLWRDSSYWSQSAAFWQELATNLSGHPAIVGYNLLNEPTPELTVHRDSAATILNRFYEIVWRAIREVDSATPIMLDGAAWASPSGMEALRPLPDENILYAFHMYEPFELTNRKANGGRFSYPGAVIPHGRDTLRVDGVFVNRALDRVAGWQRTNRIPATRIVAAEFGCHRTIGGAATYLVDVIGRFESEGWHWMFYAYREDTWDGMDYELGSKPLGAAHWAAVDRGESPVLRRKPNQLWWAIRSKLR